MEKTKTYYVEGATLTIPLRYDKQSGRYMEVYSDFMKDPVYTPEGPPNYADARGRLCFRQKE